MTADACREQRAALGAAALGGLEPASALALQAHLDGCPACRSELAELAAVARALPLADVDRLVTPVEPPRDLGELVLARVDRERAYRRRRARRRVLAVLAAVLSIVVVSAVFVAAGRDRTHPDGGETHVVFAPTRAGAVADATMRARDAGTEVAFRYSGLDAGEPYWLWLTGEDGQRVTAGTFRGTPEPTAVVLSAALPLADARRIWVTDERDQVVFDHRWR